MASSVNIVHEMINKVGFEFDDATAKKVSNLAKKAGQMAASGMTSEASVGFAKIGEIFNKELAKLGKQKIDFSKMIATPDGGTFEGMLNSFVSQISNGLIAGVNTAMSDIEKQFGTLMTKRAQAVQQRDSLEKQYRVKTAEADKLDEGYSKVISNRQTVNAGDDNFVPYAQEALANFMAINDELLEMDERGKVNAKTLHQWLASANELTTVYNTINKMTKDQQVQITPQLGKVNMNYLLGDQYQDDIAFGGDVIDNFIDNNDVYDKLTKAQEKVANLDSQITQLTSKHPELIDKQKAIEAEELVNRVQEAYNRLVNTQGKNKGQINARSLKEMESALNYVPKSKSVKQITDDMDDIQATKIKTQAKKAFETLDTLGNKYSESVGKNWEQQAQAAIKFVREYEAQMKNPQINKDMVKGWADTYKEVKPMIAEYEAMLQNVVNMANGKPLADISKIGATNKDSANSAEQKRVAEEASAEAEAKARAEAEAKVKADQEAAAAAERERLAQEAATKAAKERVNVLVQGLSGLHKSAMGLDHETMSLIGTNGVIDTVRGEGDIVDTNTLVNQLMGNFKESVLMSLHNHPGGQDLFTPEDLNSFANLYYNQGSKINGIIAGGIIKTIDFSNISQEVAANIQKKFVSNLQQENSKDPDNRYFTYDKKSGLQIENAVWDYQKTNPLMFEQSMTAIREKIDNALNDAFKQNGLESTVKTFTESQLPELAQYLLDIQKNGQNAITPIERLKNLLMTLQPKHKFDWGNHADVLSQFEKGTLDGKGAVSKILAQIKAETQAHQESINAINTEAQAQEKLNQTKTQQAQIEQSDNDGVEVAEENAKTEAIKQQNNALQENINLKGQAGGQGVGAGTVTPTGTVPSKTTPISNPTPTGTGTTPSKIIPTIPQGATSNEVGELEAVRAKVIEVTNAVNTKTQAFLAEQKAVKRVTQSEVHSLGEIEKKVASVKTAIANIHTQSNTVHTPQVNTEAFKQESQAAEGAISQEMGSLTKLRAALQLTTKRINEKTQAFETEKTVVNNVINSEINALSRLNTKVTDVNKTVMTLLQNIQNTQSTVPNIPAPQAQPTPQNNTGAQGQGSGGGSKTSPQLLNAKIDTQFSSLSLMYTQLESVGKLTPQIEQQWLQLWNSLSKVNDNNSLALWRQELTQVKNSMQEIMIANNLVEQEGEQSFQQLINITKLYNKMAIGATKAKTPEERGVYEQEANTALIEQQRILQGITLTKEQQAQYDELEIERIRQINILQAQQTGRANQIHNAQVEAEVIKQLVKLYEQLGRAQYTGDTTEASRIRGLIGAERAKLPSVDYATDMKFKHAKDKGYDSEKTKAENAALKEQESILRRLNKLYQEYGALKERSQGAGGDASRDAADIAAKDKEAEIQKLRQSLTNITPEMEAGFTESTNAGSRSERLKQYESLAKKVDQDEITRRKKIESLEREIGKLRAEADGATNTGVKNALEQEIQLRKDLIALQEQGLAMDAQDEAYYRQMYSNNTKSARAKSKQDQDDQIKLFNEQIEEAQREAGLSKSKSTESRAIETLAQASALPGITPEVQNSLNEYQSKIQSLHATITNFPKGALASDAEKKQLIQQRLEVDAYTKEIQELIAQQERLSGPNAQVTGIDMSSVLGTSPENMEAALTKQVQALTKGRVQITGYNAETQQLTYTMKAAGGGTTQYTAEINKLNGQLTLVRGTTKKAMGVFEALGAKMKQFSYYFTGSMMIYRVIGWIREGVTAVKELDSAMTELKKVTDETGATYDNFLDTASKIGSKVGSTMKDVVSSTADWARLGYTLQEAAQFAESTQILMNVSEFTDVSAATDSLISSIQAFKYTATESMDVVDILNEIGNNYAISTADLAESLTKSSGSLVAANGTLEEAVALTATANTIIQDADVVGTALKTVSMRLRGTSTKEMEEEGLETDGAITSKSKLQSKVKGLSGVDILTDTGAYKSTYQTLSEIAEVWEDIDDMDQAALLELLAGKRGGSVMAAILQNPETLKDAFESANEASGSALIENKKYMDSIQGRIDQFNNSLQTMWNNELNSDFIKWIVGLGKVLIEVIDKIGLFNVALITLITYTKIKSKLSWGEYFANIGKSITGLNTKIINLTTRFGAMGGAATAANGALNNLTVGELKNAMATYGVDKANRDAMLSQMGLTGATKDQIIAQGQLTASTLEEAVANKVLNRTQAEKLAAYFGLKLSSIELTSANAAQILSEAGVNREQKKRIIAALGLSMQTKSLTREEFINALAAKGVGTANERAAWATLFFGEATEKTTSSLKSFGKGLKNFISKNSALLTLAAVVAMITVANKVIDGLTETMEEAQDKFAETKSEFEETESTLSDLNSELKETEKRIDELLLKDSLSFVEQEELKLLQEQNDELERRISLNESIKKQQQKDLNDQALHNANKYEDIGMLTGKTSEENRGTGAKWGATAAGVGLGIAGYMGLGASLGVAAGPIGAIVGAIVGILAGALVGAAVGEGVSAVEGKVGTSLDNVKIEYDKLKKEMDEAEKDYAKDASEGNKEDYEEAKKNFDEYNSTMGKHIRELDAYYSSIDLSVYDLEKDAEKIEELKKEKNDFYDTQDIWAMETGDPNAKANAIARITGEEDFKGVTQEIEARLSPSSVEEIENKLTELGEGGEVDLLVRPEVDSKIMQDAGWDVEDGSISTVFTSTYSNEDGSVAMNFTPILPNGEVLSPDELQDYAEGVIAGTRQDDLGLQIGSAFNGEDAMQQANDAAEEIHELHEKFYLGEKLEDLTVEDLEEALSDTGKLEEYEARLEKLGLTLADVKYYYIDLAKAEKEAEKFSVNDAVKSVASLTDKVTSLREAYSEFNEQGFVTAKTLVELEETFGGLGDVWQNYIEVMATGTSSTKQATKATADLIQAFASNALADGPIKDMKEYTTLLSGLQQLGFDNPMETMEKLTKTSAMDKIAKDAASDPKAKTDDLIKKYEGEYGVEFSETERLAVEKQITAEKKKQEAEQAKTKETAYQTAKQEQDSAQDTVDNLQDKADGLQKKLNSYQLSPHGAFEKKNAKGEVIESLNEVEYKKIQDEYTKTAEELTKAQEKLDGIQLPTKVDADKAAKDAEKAVEEAQTALDDAGLGIEVELITSNQAVDDIQSIYDTLVNAQKEYNEQGYLSVDTMQSLLTLEPKYLAMLFNENGQLNLNRDAILSVAQARLFDMTQKQIDSIITEASKAAKSGEIDKLKELTDVLYDAADAQRTFNLSKMEELKINLANPDLGLSESEQNAYYKKVEQQVNSVISTYNRTVANLPKALSSGSSSSGESALEALQKRYERKIKNLEGQQTWIENEIEKLEAQEEGVSADYYEKQIDLEEEKIALYEQERAELLKLKRTDEVADAIWEVEHAIQESTLRMIEFRKSIAELYATAAQDISDAYDRKGQLHEDKTTYIENEISIRETKGEIVPLTAYDELMEQEEEHRSDLKAERDDLQALYDQGIRENAFTKDSEEALDIIEQIRQKELDIQESEQKSVDYALQKVEAYEKLSEKMSDAYDNISQLFEDRKSYTENEISIIEAEGGVVSPDVYKELVAQAKSNRDNAQKELNDQTALYWEGINKGDFEENSETAIDLLEKIRQKKLDVQESTKQILEYEKQIAQAYEQLFDNMSKAYSNIGQLFDDRESYIENEIAMIAERGGVVSPEVYKELMRQEVSNNDNLRSELDSMEGLYWEGINKGDFEENSETAIDLLAEIRKKKLEIQESDQEILKYEKQILQVYEELSTKMSEDYSSKGQLFEDRNSIIETEISIRKTKGEIIPTSIYDEAIEQEKLNRENLQSEIAAQEGLYWEGINKGDFTKDDDVAIAMAEKIRKLKLDEAKSEEAIAKYVEEKKDAYIEYYDKMMETYSHRNDFIQDQSDFAQSYIDRLDTLNINVPDEAYEKIAEIQEMSVAGLREQLAFANSELAKFEEQGIDKNDPRYIEKFNEALELEEEIYNKETKVYETHQKIFDNQIDRFNQVLDRINDATKKMQNVSGLLDREDVATEDGEWTAEGLTRLGMAYQQMEYYNQSADEVAKKMAEVEEAYQNGEISEKKYYETMQALEDQQWEAINSAEDMKDTIIDLNEARIDMIEEGIDKEIEAYQELIDLKNEALDAERDLYDFRKDIQKQTKDIAALERRIASMSGSTDAATIAERTKLEAELREAREGLDDTYYSHAMDSQSNALGDEFESFTKSSEDYLEQLRESIKDTNLLIEKTFTDVMQNGQTVLEKLTTLSNTYGIQLDGYLTSPWKNATTESLDFDTYATQHFNTVYETVETNTEALTGYLKAPWEAGESQAKTFSEEVQRYITQEVVEYAQNHYQEKLKQIVQYPWDDEEAAAFWGQGVQDVLTQKVVEYAQMNYQELFKTILDYPWQNAKESHTWGLDIQRILTQEVVGYAQNNYQELFKTILNYPWENAKEKQIWGQDVQRILTQEVVEYSQKNYQEKLKGILDYPWNNANKYNTWGTGVKNVLDSVITKANEAARAMGNLTGQEITLPTHEGKGSGNGNGNLGYNPGYYNNSKMEKTGTLGEAIADYFGQSPYNKNGSKQVTIDGVQYYMRNMSDKNGNVYTYYYKWSDNSDVRTNGRGGIIEFPKGTAVYRKNYAKGTLGTTKDEWALTDESWIGEEITLAAGKNGQLQYLKKGSAVMPADISANLVEWGKLNPNMMNIGGGANLNMINNAVNKPELNFTFDSLVHVDNCSQDTLKDLEKMVDTKINQFNKQLNQSLRKFK